MKNLLTIDVEDYYQVSGLSDLAPYSKWDDFTSRIESSLEVILSALSSIKATFFILGYEAEKRPQLVKRISALGHNTASHGKSHRLIYNMSPQEFKAELSDSIKRLEDLTGKAVLGYRAPSFSIIAETMWAFEVMAELGLKYDSSIVPVTRRRGGIPGAEEKPFYIDTPSGKILEFPLPVTVFLGKKIPVAGGGFFRFYPYYFTQKAISKTNNQGLPVTVYLHPWEFDPLQPRLRSFFNPNGFKHYYNLNRTLNKFRRLLKDFQFISMEEYIAVNR